MRTFKAQQVALKADPSTIHLKTVGAFVFHHCQSLTWSDRALGFIRARNLKGLVELAADVQEKLVLAASGDTSWATEYPDAHAFARGYQFVALVSKYKYPEGSIQGLDPVTRAKEDFLRAERRNKRLNIIFRIHQKRGTDRHWSFKHVRKFFLRVLGETPPFEDILDKSDFSGGASISCTGTTTHLAAKLGAPVLRGSMESLGHFKLAIWRNEHFRSQFLPVKNAMICYDRDALVEAIDGRFEVCEYNKIEVVTKNAKSGRTIAKEPEANNCLQKGADLVMRDFLHRRVGIDLRRQEPNQKRARIAASSWDESDPDVTIDVKGASNSVLLEAVRSVSPPRWFKLLDQLRSKNFMLDGVVQPYEMFCSMGNGFCFPLETLLFAAICDAAYRYCGLKPDYRCYGDDIIVKRSVALVVIECLNAFGFRVNQDKTYVHGPFRESCGANSYGGQEVTPGYYKDQITTLSELYAQHNSLARWPEVQAVLRSFVEPSQAHVVPDIPQYAFVTNQAFKVPLDQAMTSSRVYWSRRLQSWQTVLLSERPKADSKWLNGFKGSYPEDMVLTAVLRGAQRPDEPFHLRHTVRTTKTRTDHSPVALDNKRTADWWSTGSHNAHVVQWAMRKNRSTAHLQRALRKAVVDALPLVTGVVEL